MVSDGSKVNKRADSSTGRDHNWRCATDCRSNNHFEIFRRRTDLLSTISCAACISPTTPCRLVTGATLVYISTITILPRSLAKHFSHITSARRARKSDLPHFRLNKVRNIKLWLSLRSYIRRRGAQRSVDIIVSSSFIVVLAMLSVIAVSLIHGNVFDDSSPVLWEVTFNSVTCGFFVMQILTQGSKINKRFV